MNNVDVCDKISSRLNNLDSTNGCTIVSSRIKEDGMEEELN